MWGVFFYQLIQFTPSFLGQELGIFQKAENFKNHDTNRIFSVSAHFKGEEARKLEDFTKSFEEMEDGSWGFYIARVKRYILVD